MVYPLPNRDWQPAARYLLLEEQAWTPSELEGLHDLVAALFRLEQSRDPEDLERVVAALVTGWQPRRRTVCAGLLSPGSSAS